MKNKLLAASLVLAMTFSLTTFAREIPTDIQTASATLESEKGHLGVYIDLTGGYSVDFASGAVYLYEGSAVADGTEPVAMGITLDEDVYNEYVAAAMDKEPLTDSEDIISYAEDGEKLYLYNIDGAYFMIVMDEEVEEPLQDRFYFEYYAGDTEIVAVETEAE